MFGSSKSVAVFCPPLPLDLLASFGLRFSPVLLSPPSPPEPPVPPDPPDPPPEQICISLLPGSLSKFAGHSLPPLTSGCCSAFRLPFTAVCRLFVPSGGSRFAFRLPFTAVCSLCSGLDPVSASTRSDSGSLITLSTVYLRCRLVLGIRSLIRWMCVPILVTFVSLNVLVICKFSLTCLPWMWFHVYSFMECYVLSNSLFCGIICIAGNKIFFDFARLTISSLQVLSWWFSNTVEVLLQARHRYVTFAKTAEGFVLKTPLEAIVGAEITYGVFSLDCLWLDSTLVEHVSSLLSPYLCLVFVVVCSLPVVRSVYWSLVWFVGLLVALCIIPLVWD